MNSHILKITLTCKGCNEYEIFASITRGEMPQPLKIKVLSKLLVATVEGKGNVDICIKLDVSGVHYYALIKSYARHRYRHDSELSLK